LRIADRAICDYAIIELVGVGGAAGTNGYAGGAGQNGAINIYVY